MTTQPTPAVRPSLSATLRTVLRDLPTPRLQLALLAALVALLALALTGYRIQLTGSGPRGIWQFKGSAAVVGSWVAICPEPSVAALAKARGYLSSGHCAGDVAPMLKRVVAVPGDSVAHGPAGIAVGDVLLPNTAVRPADSRGRPLPHPDWGTYEVADGTLWVANAKPDSFDSRYFGPVDAARLISVVDAVLVAGGD